MLKSETISKLAEALSKAQGQFKPAVFDCVNPHFKSEYASLASIMCAVREGLAQNGLSITQTIGEAEGKITLTTILLHSSGEWIQSIFPLLLDRQNMQALGSAVTYARRYQIAALLGVVADQDDDAESATFGAKVPPKKTILDKQQQTQEDIPVVQSELNDSHVEEIKRIAEEHSWSGQQVLVHMKARFGADKLRQLTLAQFNTMCEAIKTMTPAFAVKYLIDNPNECIFNN